jgi:murein DD-endopeptidase
VDKIPVSKFIDTDYPLKLRSGYGVKRTTHIHKGWDVPIPQGTKLLSPGDGVVHSVGYDNLNNYRVIIHYPVTGLYLMFLHISKSFVKPKDKVTGLQKIALSGGIPGTHGAGTSRGAHVHIEVHLPYGNPINPSNVFTI